MLIEDIEKAFSQSMKVMVKYRDPYGFIVKGIILTIDKGEIVIDSYKQRVDPCKIISIEHI